MSVSLKYQVKVSPEWEWVEPLNLRTSATTATRAAACHLPQDFEQLLPRALILRFVFPHRYPCAPFAPNLLDAERWTNHKRFLLAILLIRNWMTMCTTMKNYSQDATLFNENELYMGLFHSADLFPGRSVNENTELCLYTSCTQRLLFTHLTSSPHSCLW